MAPYANGNGRLHSPKKGRDGLLRRKLVCYLLLPAVMAMFVISLLVNQNKFLAQRASFYHRKTFIDRSEPTQFQEPTEYSTDIPTTISTTTITTTPSTKPFPTDNDDDAVLHKQQEQQQHYFPFENSTLPIDTDTRLEDIDKEQHVDDETILQDDDDNDTPIGTTTTQPPSSSAIEQKISSIPNTPTTTEDTIDPQAIIDSLQDSVALAALAAQQQQQQQQQPPPPTNPSITLIDDINTSITGDDTPIITDDDTNGLFSKVAVEDAWWSNVIAKNGTIVPKIVHPPPIVTTIDINTSGSTSGFNNSSSSSGGGGLVMGPPLSLSSTTKGRTDYHLKPSDIDPTFMKNCKIAVIDTAEIFGPMMGAPTCSLNNPAIWPFDDNSSSDSFLTDQSSTAISAFNRPVHGIDGSAHLSPEEYQYSMEWWLTNGIRDSGRFTKDLENAQFVYIDMHCYHVLWLTFMHPHHGIGGVNKGAMDPTPYLERSLQMVLDIPRFKLTKGADFGLARPSPSLRGLFREEALCEDLASVFSLVAEHSSLCVWTPDAALQGKAMVMPYLAVTDLPPPTGSNNEGGDDAWDALTAERERFITFQGGCGTRDPAYRDMFYAGKMMRLSVVEELHKMQQEDERREKEQQQEKEASSSSSSSSSSTNNGSQIHAECACDICDGAVPHAQLMELYRHTTFCPIIPSNVQSSRRLTEVILSGCIPVFMGPPFHTLPLGDDVDWEAAAVFLDITDTGPWINGTSSNWRHNKMINLAWKLDANIKRNPETSNSGTSLLSSYDGMIKVANIKDSIALLKAMPIEAVGTKQQALAKIAPLFDYRPHPTDGTSSALVELVMDKMCTRAAEVEMRMKKAKEDGLLDGVGGRDGERVRKKDMKLFSYL